MTARNVRPLSLAFNIDGGSDNEDDDRPSFGLGGKISSPEKNEEDNNGDNDDDDDDYMNMVIAEPVSKETTLQRRERLKREVSILCNRFISLRVHLDQH